MATGWLIAFTVIYFISGVIMCPVSKAVADDKGYNGTLFAVATVLFGGIGFLSACALPDKNKKSDETKELTEKIAALTEAVNALSEGKRPDVGIETKREEDPSPRQNTNDGYYRPEDGGDSYRRPAFSAKKTSTTANLMFKDGKLVCSACGERIGFNDETCPYCGATIVPAGDSEGGFFKKKQ